MHLPPSVVMMLMAVFNIFLGCFLEAFAVAPFTHQSSPSCAAIPRIDEKERRKRRENCAAQRRPTRAAKPLSALESIEAMASHKRTRS
jgi:hypothetical protein